MRGPQCWLGKLATVLQFGFLVAVLLPAPAWREPVLDVTAAVSAAAGVDYVGAYRRRRFVPSDNRGGQ